MALAFSEASPVAMSGNMTRWIAGAALALSSVTIAGCGVSTQQEIEIGQQNVQQINQQLPIVRDAEINRYINVLGDSIAKLTARPDLPWTFYVVDSREVNAFAVPGGYIYVNRGLIERTTKLDQLAGVLGHEIGHVVKRHSIKQMEQMQGANMGLALGCILTNICNSEIAQVGINAAGGLVFAKFSRDDEREADEVGIDNVVRAGISPNGVPEMFQILLAERQRNPSSVDLWFSTHPTEEDRLNETRARIALINPAVLRSLTTDTPSYQAFKRRVQSLPVPRSP
jgi:predicted Zn-dependent protease